MTALSLLTALTPSSVPPLTSTTSSSSSLPPSWPLVRSTFRSIRSHLQRFFLPENSWLLSVFLFFYLCKKLHEWSQHKQTPSTLPLPIDHSLYPQYIVNKDRLWLYHQQWLCSATECRAYVFISPAYCDHSLRYESVARAFNSLGFSVFSLDHQGQGQSAGDRGYFESFDDMVEDYLLFVEHVRANLEPKPCFLLGRGQGATVAIQVMRAYQELEEERKRDLQSRPSSLQASPTNALSKQQFSSSPRPNSPSFLDDPETRAASWSWHGAILLAPAIIPPPTVSPLEEMFAHLFTDLLPKFGFFNFLDEEKLSRLPAVVAQNRSDPLVFRGPMLARWGTQLLATMDELKQDSHEITFPFLVLQGSADTYVSPRGAEWLYARSQSKDKKIKRYTGAYHDLLNDAHRDQVFNDIIRWLEPRIEATTDSSSSQPSL